MWSGGEQLWGRWGEGALGKKSFKNEIDLQEKAKTNLKWSSPFHPYIVYLAQVTIREEEDIEPRVTTKEFAHVNQLAHELDFEIKTLPSGSKKVNE